jgi:hypothetical protein
MMTSQPRSKPGARRGSGSGPSGGAWQGPVLGLRLVYPQAPQHARESAAS